MHMCVVCVVCGRERQRARVPAEYAALLRLHGKGDINICVHVCFVCCVREKERARARVRALAKCETHSLTRILYALCISICIVYFYILLCVSKMCRKHVFSRMCFAHFDL